MTFQAGAESTRGPGRPPGSRNRRTQEILDLIKARGDKDPLEVLSDIASNSTNPDHRISASNSLAPYLHSKRGTSVAPRYVDDPIQVPNFTTIQEAQNFLADIARRSGSGELELQSANDISNLVKNWILSITAQDEYQLKLQAQGGGADTTIRITGGLPPLPGSNIIGMGGEESSPRLNGHTNGHGPVIEHANADPPALTQDDSSEAQEPDA
jgi:hypothetical protein